MKEMKKTNLKLVGIVAATVVAVTVAGTFCVQSSQNRAIALEESVYTAESDIRVQEKRRVDLIYNLADCVKRYGKHESDTLKELAGKMGQSSDMEDVNTAIAAVAFAYPELKSNETYKQLMQELSTTENMIAQSRENYNQTISKYNRSVRRFPARAFLDFTGYEVRDFERLDYDAPVNALQDLFEGDVVESN